MDDQVAKVVKYSKQTVFPEYSGPARVFNLVASKTCYHSGRTPSRELGLGLPFVNSLARKGARDSTKISFPTQATFHPQMEAWSRTPSYTWISR